MAEKEIKNIELTEKLYELHDKIHILVLRLSGFIFIIANAVAVYFGKFEISIFSSILIYSLIFIFYKIIKNEKIKLYLISITWVMWFFLFTAINGGNANVLSFYYFFLFVLVLYQYPKVFPIIAFLALIYNIVSFSALWGFEEYQELIQSYFYSKQVNYEDFIIQLIGTNIGVAIVWRISIILHRNTVKNILSDISQKQQSELLEKNKAFAEEIAVGNLDVKIKTADNDILGKSLGSMKDSLQKAKKRETLEKERNDFVNIGLVTIGKILRSENEITNMTKKIISVLTKYMNAKMGAIFLTVNDRNGKVTHLELQSAYAYDKEKHMNLKILPGSGLIGTTFLEKETIFLTDIPTDYIKIKSVLGETLPKCLLLSPLISNGEIVGVIELASIKIFEKYEIDFVNTISENIASTIINTIINKRTEQLLMESKKLTVEMQEQEEELKQNMEEMKATQEEAANKIDNLEAELSKFKH